MKHELRRRCVRWLEKHWKQHEPEEHHLYLYDRNETVAVPEFHTGKASEKKISPLMYVLTVLFILKYVLL